MNATVVGDVNVRSRVPLPRSRNARSAGQGLVEFALVFPVFMLILFGLIDVGRFVYMSSTLSQAAREGARLGATEASWIGSSDPACNQSFGPVCPNNTTALRTHVTAAANRMMVPFGTVSQVYVQCDAAGSAPTGDWSTTDCPAASRQTGDVVSVRVELQFAPLLGVIGPITTSGSATMVIN
jgi:Flp pilus assembly protein TadG